MWPNEPLELFPGTNNQIPTIGKQQLYGWLISRVLTKLGQQMQPRSQDGISQYIRL